MNNQDISFVQSFAPKDDISFVYQTLLLCCTDKSKLFYIYGGAVRDIIRNTKPNDIDVYIKDEVNIVSFLDFLRRSDRLRKETCARNSGYMLKTIEIQTSMSTTCFIDITCDTSRDGAESSIYNCDFTCNNLIINREGNISTRLPPPRAYMNLSPPMWTVRCIGDALAGNLVFMVPDELINYMSPRRYISMQAKISQRINKLVARGFKQPLSKLTSFDNRPLKEYQFSDDNDACPICKEEYSSKPSKETVVLKCDHHFHIDCIDTWVTSTKASRTCPVCRQPLRLSWVIANNILMIEDK